MINCRLIHDYAIVMYQNPRSTPNKLLSIKPFFYRGCFTLPVLADLGPLYQAIDWDYRKDGPGMSLDFAETFAEVSNPVTPEKDLARTNYGYILDASGALYAAKRVSWLKGLDGVPRHIYYRTAWGEDIIEMESTIPEDEKQNFLASIDRVENNIESICSKLDYHAKLDGRCYYCYVINLKHVVEALNGEREVNKIEMVNMLDRYLRTQDLVIAKINQPVVSKKKGSKTK